MIAAHLLSQQRSGPIAWLGDIYGLLLQSIQELDHAMATASGGKSAA